MNNLSPCTTLGRYFHRRYGAMQQIYGSTFSVALLHARGFVIENPGAAEEDVRRSLHDCAPDTASGLLDQVGDMAEMRVLALENILIGFSLLVPRKAELVMNSIRCGRIVGHWKSRCNDLISKEKTCILQTT